MNCILYARVSTGRQAKKDLSIPAQLDLMRAFASERAWTVVDKMEEPGKTAKTPDRPIFRNLLARIEKGNPKIDAVLVHKFDRWMRSVLDHHLIKRQLASIGVRVISVTEPVDDTAHGRWVENMTAANNEWYSDSLAERVIIGMRKKVELGGWPHKPPRGYIVAYDTSGSSQIKLHPSEAPLIRLAFERYAAGGCSLREIAESLNDDGIVSLNGRRLGLAYINRMLTNPFYIGRLKWGDLNVEGGHEPLVSITIFERVASMLKRRGKDPGAKGSVNGFPLRGLAVCASCKGHMTASWQKKRFGYYRCSRRSYNRKLCSAVAYCPSKLAEAQVSKLCASLELTQAAANAVLECAEARINREAATSGRHLESLRTQRTHLLEREVKLTEKYVSGDVSSDAYLATGKKVRAELAGVDRALERGNVDYERVRKTVKDILSRAQSVRALGDSVGGALRPAWLRSVFRNLVLGADGLVGFTLRKPLDTLLLSKGAAASPSLRHVNHTATALVEHAAADSVVKPVSEAS